MGWVGYAVILVLTLNSSGAIVTATMPAPASGPRAMLLAEASSGRVLREEAADDQLMAGSLGHLMIALLVTERVQEGQLSEAQLLPVSAAAVDEPGARLAMRVGHQVSLQELMKALIVAEAPDAAVVLAEALGGSLEAIGTVMNERAAALGMTGTSYKSSAGGTSSGEFLEAVTSARDTARLVGKLFEHREILEWAGLSGMPFRSGSVLLRNPNQLLMRVPGANGLIISNTGHRGLHLVASAKRAGMQLIAVALGAADDQSRYGTTAAWLEWGFATYTRVQVVKAGEPVSIPIGVRSGLERVVMPVAGCDLVLLQRRDQERDFEFGFQLPDTLTAPVARHQRLGEIIVRDQGRVLAVVPAISPRDIPAAEVPRSAGLGGG